jgi:uncharacterized protein YbjT (DUF2867 family)
MSRTILVAGASGALGRRVAQLLRDRGWRVRALGRSADRLRALGDIVAEPVVVPRLTPRALAPAVDGVDAVFSTLGANVLPDARLGWRGFRAVDRDLNRVLVAAAAAAGVRKMTYVSVYYNSDTLRRLGYVRAHEEVVDAMRASGMAWSVVRPTGFFSAIGSFVAMARRGRLPAFGRPEARTNPIHDDDLAAVCADAVDGDATEIAAGGPEVVTRHQMGELAFAALGLPPRFLRLPSWLMRTASLALYPVLPRVADLLGFFNAVGAVDLIAPAHGTRTLGAYFKELAQARGG